MAAGAVPVPEFTETAAVPEFAGSVARSRLADCAEAAAAHTRPQISATASIAVIRRASLRRWQCAWQRAWRRGRKL